MAGYRAPIKWFHNWHTHLPLLDTFNFKLSTAKPHHSPQLFSSYLNNNARCVIIDVRALHQAWLRSHAAAHRQPHVPRNPVTHNFLPLLVYQGRAAE